MDNNENKVSQWLNGWVGSSINCNAENNQENIELVNVSILPDLLNKSVNLIKKNYPNISRNVLISEVIMKISQMITSKRVKYSMFGDTVYPNYYAIIFMPSGYGKDKLSNDLDEYFFKNFRLWFKNKEEQVLLNMFLKMETKDFFFIFMMKKGKRRNFQDSGL